MIEKGSAEAVIAEKRETATLSHEDREEMTPKRKTVRGRI